MSWLSKTCKKLKKITLKQALPVIAAVTALIPGVGVLVAGGLAAVTSAIGKVGGAVGKGATAAIGTAIKAVEGVSSLGTVTEAQVAAGGGPLVAGAIPKKIKTWMILAVAALVAYLLFWKKAGHAGVHHHSAWHYHSKPHSGSRRAVQLANLARGRAKLAGMRAAGTVPHHRHRRKTSKHSRYLVAELGPKKRVHRRRKSR